MDVTELAKVEMDAGNRRKTYNAQFFLLLFLKTNNSLSTCHDVPGTVVCAGDKGE